MAQPDSSPLCEFGLAFHPSLFIHPCYTTVDSLTPIVTTYLDVGMVLRIRRHDALRDILYATLLQDNRMTRREQCVCNDSQNRLGDVYHPDFSDGQATYFVITVANTLSQAIL